MNVINSRFRDNVVESEDEGTAGNAMTSNSQELTVIRDSMCVFSPLDHHSDVWL